jgi:thiaminase/transcriptional activator TenA
MGFADTILTEDMDLLRSKLLHHPLWERVIDGTLEVARLRLFALQDWWLVRQAYRLDALAIASVSDLETQELLINKLTPKVGGHKLLLRFGEALGLSQTDFDTVEPLAGCMALTTFFYWMLAYGSVGEKLAAVGASEDIFVRICARVKPALLRNYGLSEKQVEFFTAHDVIGERVVSVDESLLQRYTSLDERQHITHAVRLSHEFELLFYDTIMVAPIDQA